MGPHPHITFYLSLSLSLGTGGPGPVVLFTIISGQPQNYVCLRHPCLSLYEMAAYPIKIQVAVDTYNSEGGLICRMQDTGPHRYRHEILYQMNRILLVTVQVVLTFQLYQPCFCLFHLQQFSYCMGKCIYCHDTIIHCSDIIDTSESHAWSQDMGPQPYITFSLSLALSLGTGGPGPVVLFTIIVGHH